MARGRCPYCGLVVQTTSYGMTYRHTEEGAERPCPGARQNARHPESDRRPTWRHEERVGKKWDPWVDPDYDPALWREEPAA